MNQIRCSLPAFALLIALAVSAPAAAAPIAEGTVSAASPTFTWEGGPLSGVNLVGEPCGTTHTCEYILLHISDAGELETSWTASDPSGNAWLNFALYKSDAEGNPQGDAVGDGGAFANKGAFVTPVEEPGDYVMEVGALTGTATTYEAAATLKPGDPEANAEYGEQPPDASSYDWYKQAGADWFQAYIDEADGTRLHADILRPAGVPADKKTPVILSIGPYFNHSGQVGAAGPAQGATYDPFATPGPSNRFADFVLGADVIRKGYTFVMVDLRGFGGSTGCLDWGGPGEQADVVAAVEWAASQPWSTGKVGMYGKSYDGVTGLLGEILNPKGLAAVVAQEPVYDMYRYLYSEGMRYLNSAATPMLYNAIAMSPGSAMDDTEYLGASANSTARPGCEAGNYSDQQDPNHDSEYWTVRDLIAPASKGKTPLFLTQGFLENNTKPDGTWDFFNAIKAPKRAWFGMWDHVRGQDMDSEGRLLMGRRGFNGEVMRFYDQYLKGVEPKVKDPTLVIQTNDGTWRAEEQWPPADSKKLTVPLSDGAYVDDAGNMGTNDGLAANASPGIGIWTISPPLPHEVHLGGVPRIKLDVETSMPNANLAAAVYEIDEENSATLVHRQGRLIPEGGTYEFDLYGNDWTVPAGHRLGVLVSTAHAEWWLLAAPTFQDVAVANASVDLPFLKYRRDEHIHGKRAVRLENYLANAPFELDPETIDSATSDSFPMPSKLKKRRPAGGTTNPGGKPNATKKRLTARIVKKRRGRVLLVRGRAPVGSKLKVKLMRGKKKVVKAKRDRAGKRGRYKTRFRVKRAGRYRAKVRLRGGEERMRARTKRVRIEPRR